MNNNIYKYLELLWLSPKEAKIYITILRLWNCKAWLIAQKSNISRSTVYQVINNLINKKLIFKINKWKIQSYIAEEPEKILSNLNDESKQIERKKKIFNSIYPEILKIKKLNNYLPKIIYFEWINNYINLLNEVLKTWEKEIFMLSSTEIKNNPKNLKNKELHNYEVWIFLKERLKRKIFMNLITTKKDFWEEILSKDNIEYRKTKLLPENFWDIETMIIYWENLLILTDNHPIVWIYISDKQIRNMMKTFFDYLWKTI